MKHEWSVAARLIQQSTWRYGRGVPLAVLAWLCISHTDIVAQTAPTVLTGQQEGELRRFTEAQKSELLSRQVRSLVTLSIQDSTIGYVIRAIGKQMNVPVVFDNADPRFTKHINIRLTDESMMDALSVALRGTGLSAMVAKDGRTIVVGDRSSPGKARDSVATGQVAGVVVDSATGKPIIGATVEIPQFKKRVLTSEKGAFVIPGIAVGSSVVAVRFIGYRSTSRSVTVTSGQTATLRIVLSQSASLLSGVVTTATGVQRRVEVGNDITVINVPDVLQKNPVSTLTDLLATRVPGLVVGRASGEPGAKTEIRIRGTGSIRASNSPILVVDGVQVISDRSGIDSTGFATSPFDQVDLNSAETVEILKGPSAVAMYGSNAANGVIIVTTKRGREGPMRWNMSMDMSMEILPGEWPQNYFAWGENLSAGVASGVYGQCDRYASGLVLNWGAYPACRYDSTSTYQILNNPGTTVFGTGLTKRLSGGVNGGSRQFLYALTGTYSSTLGVLKLPDDDVDLLAKAGVDINSWQRRPQALATFSGTLNLNVALKGQSELRTTSTILRQDKRSTPLIKALGISSGMTPPVQLYDGDGVPLGFGSGLLVTVPDFMGADNWIELGFYNSATFSATLWNAWKFETTAGLDVKNGHQTYLLKAGDYCPVSGAVKFAFGNCAQRAQGVYYEDYKSYRTTAIGTDLTVRASVPAKGYKWFNVTPRIGLNVTGITRGQSGVGAGGLPMGGLGIRGAETVRALADGQSARRTVGMYAELGLKIGDQLFLPLSVRTDVGNAIGSQSKPVFPGIQLSYVASDKPSFREIPVIGRIPELRLRTSFGISGRQPGLADKYQTFVFTRFPIDNEDVSVANLYTVGNSKLSPEFVREWEMGFDITAIDRTHDRWSGTVTLVRKNTSNLLAPETLPLSLGTVRSRISNIGDVMNQSFEVTLEGFHRTGWLDWSSNNGISMLRGKLLRLKNQNHTSLLTSNQPGRAVSIDNYVGYPLNGFWARPIVGYIDGNENGLLEPDEVVYGDTKRYLGSPDPRFTFTSNQQVTFAARLTLTATLSYENGASSNSYSANIGQFSRMMNDPTLSLEEQAKLLYDGAAAAYRVSTLRLQTMQLTYVVPPRITERYLRSRSLQIAVSGTNLGIWSTFEGQDPALGGILRLQNKAILPMPRTYGVSMRVQ